MFDLGSCRNLIVAGVFGMEMVVKWVFGEAEG